MHNPTPSGTWRRPQRLSNETSINNTATIESIKRMADLAWRELEAAYDSALPGHHLHSGGYPCAPMARQLKKAVEHVANLVHRIKTELV